MEIVIFLIAGAIAGCLSGLFGLGGGAIVVPALVLSFDVMNRFPGNVMQVAEGTSLAIMIVTTASSIVSHYRRGNVLGALVFRLVPGMVVGVFLGSILAHFMSSYCLRIIFGCFLLLASCLMFRLAYRESRRTSAALEKIPGIFSAAWASVFIGFFSGLLGTGAGSLSVPYLSRYHFKMKNIAAIASLCSFPIAVIGAVTFLFLGLHKIHAPWTTGYINWMAFFFVALTGLVFAPLGARLAVYLNALLLKRMFAVILLLLAIQMLYGAF